MTTDSNEVQALPTTATPEATAKTRKTRSDKGKKRGPRKSKASA